MNVAVCPEQLNIISLCAGGGGLDLGLELACPTARPVVLVEREAFAVAHLVAAMREGLLAEAAVWSDVRTFPGRSFRGLVDGVIGGIPCQPHSLAGKRLGEDDERDLWSDARRIIVQSGAWFVVIENVEGMLTSGGAARVVRDLRRLGFAVEIGLFSAAETGASHQRNRVFIVAVANGRLIGQQRRRRAADVPCQTGEAEGARNQWQWDGSPARDGGEDLVVEEQLADATSTGRRREWPESGSEPCRGSGETRWLQPGRLGSEVRGTVADADGGKSSLDLCVGRHTREECSAAAGVCRPVDDATCVRDRPVSVQQGQSRRADIDLAGSSAGNALSLFPPGPADLDGWRRVLAHSPHLEPAVCRMADGVAARLDLAGPHAARIERLRLLGNGVVPLQAAYAIRTLCARLAAQGSAGAAHLVRLMECA